MKKTAAVYAWTISVLGMFAGIYCVAGYFAYWADFSRPQNVIRFAIILILFILCRSLPLYINKEQAIDMSFICIFATVLVSGPVMAAVATALTMPLVVVPVGFGGERRYEHFFNTPPVKSLFNTANLVLSILAAGMVFRLSGGEPGKIGLPQVLWPSFTFILVVMLINSSVLMGLFHINGQGNFFSLIFGNVGQFVPSIAAAAPIGFFLARLMLQDSGEYLALLFMLPLLLARYAFKLYLDSRQNYYHTIKTLTAAIEAKDKYTEGHSKRVEEYAERIGMQLHLSAKAINNLKVAALLHDLGKIGIDDTILRKPGPLNEEEFDVIKMHPEIGLKILEEINFPSGVKDIILYHHERYDGHGYPMHLQKDQIPMEAYILMVADSFDAITSDRPYRTGRPMEKAVEIIRGESGKQFHPKVVEAFLQCYGKK